ncbi:DUF6538 domain-containing protein [Rhodospirillum rubrum]|nr:DUF6538 domain-containing protein [Rhodospirillum rubrum]QXG80054.1 tyrosine-type recombinase/integrase [Rhodospirillum rubrum]
MEDVKHPRLTRRGRIYWFRAKVPADLRSHYAPKTEIIYSLKTSDPREALVRVRIASVKADQEFEVARRIPKEEVRTSLSDDEAERLVAIYYQVRLEEDEEIRIGGKQEADLYLGVKAQLEALGIGHANYTNEEAVAEYGLSQREYQKNQETLEFMEPLYREALSTGNTEIIHDELDDILEANSIKLDRTSSQYRKLAFSILKATVKVLDVEKRRNSGEPIDTPPEPPPLFKPAVTAVPANSLRLSEVFERWKVERKPAKRSLMEWDTAIRRFTALYGDKPVESITKAEVVEFKDSLLQQGKAAATVLKQVGAIKSTLQYAVDNGKLSVNPATGVKVAGKRASEVRRLPYDAEDLKAIFSSPVFTCGDRPLAGSGEASFWLPLLALFTGARLNEIGQILVSDVRELDGIHYLDLNTEGEGKSLKNEGSRRKVPLHPEIIRLGFLDYVRKQGESLGSDSRVFDKLEPNSNGVLTANFSKWWGRYARENGIAKGQKVFHSFRHSFKDACRESSLPQDIHDALTGHSPNNVGGRYGQGFTVRRLGEEMAKLSYPGLDLSGLMKP